MTRDTVKQDADLALAGSIPYESATYYFAGWYADAACTEQITDATIAQKKYAVRLEENRLIPIKSTVSYEDDKGDTFTGSLYSSATYYALFLPRSADLTIQINSGAGDSFILNLVGNAGTFAEGKSFTVAVHDGVATTVTDVPIGTYTVTMDQNWSWRYETLNTAVEVVVSAGGSMTLTLNPQATQWLTEDTHGVYSTGQGG